MTTFKEQVAAERERQIQKGYDAAHDDAHGPTHLMELANKYEKLGEFVKASAVYQAYVEAGERRKNANQKVPS